MEIKMMMKMVINTKNIYVIVTALLAALISPSCVSMGEGQDTEVGYLTIGGFDVDVTVGQLSQTRAAVLPEISEPESVIYKITDVNGASYRSDESSWQNPLILPVGKYTVEAWSGSNTFGAPYFYGKSDGTIGVESKTETVVLEVANSLVAVSMAEGFDKHFTPAGDDCVTFTSGGVSVSAAVDEYVFVPASSELTVLVKGKNSAEVYKELTYELTSPAKRTACSIVCGLTTTDAPSVTLASDLSAGAFEGVLYFPAATVANISNANAAKLTYEIKGGSDTDWTEVTVGEITENGKTYKYITGLTSGKTYSLRAKVGNIFSEGVSFTQVDFDDCVSVVASADHTKDDNGDLDGTKVTASVDITRLPSIIKELATVTPTTGTFTNSEGNIRSEIAAKTTSSKDGQPSLEMKNPDGWPYIPQGENLTMTVTATCEIGEETYTTTSSKDGIKVPEPVFTPTVSLGNTSYTSYDKYAGPDAGNGISKLINGNKDQGTIGANDCQPETLYYPSVVIGGIHENLLTNTNYEKLIEFYLDKGTQNAKTNRYSNPEMSNNTYTGEDFTSLSWGAHTLTASFTFDGISATFNGSAKTHHITGLPFSQDLRSNQDMTLWHIDGDTKFDNDRGLQIAYVWATDNSKDYTKVYSPAFQFPINTNTSVNYEIGAVFYTSGAYSHTVQIYSGIVQGVESYSQTNKDNISVSKSYGKTISQYNYSGDMTKDSRVSIYHNEWYISGEFFQPQYWMLVATLSVKYDEK